MANSTYEIGDMMAGGSVSGMTKGDYRANPTNEDIVLYSGYKTVANGYAEDIVVPAGMGLRRWTNGGPSDFATYKVVSIEEAQAHI